MLSKYAFSLKSELTKEDIRALSFTLLGYRYQAKTEGMPRSGFVSFHPVQTPSLYHNSFIPDITVTETCPGSTPEYRITCTLKPFVRGLMHGIMFFLLVIQAILLIHLAAAKAISFSLFIPLLMLLFIFFLCRIMAFLTKKALLDVFKPKNISLK